MTWVWVLLLKALIVPVLIAVYYFGIVLPLRWAYRALPPSPLKDALFKKRGGGDPDYGPGYEDVDLGRIVAHYGGDSSPTGDAGSLRQLPDGRHDRTALPRR